MDLREVAGDLQPGQNSASGAEAAGTGIVEDDGDGPATDGGVAANAAIGDGPTTDGGVAANAAIGDGTAADASGVGRDGDADGGGGERG
jgi:hypothetical protein